MKEFIKYVGLDTHKDTIAVAVAEAGGGEVRYFGEIANRPGSVTKLVRRLSGEGEVLAFCYEAGPCGYGLYRQLEGLGQVCEVVAPGLIPRKPGERVRTDRRDAMNLARLHRAGELTAVWVPDEAQEAIRDLVRARGDMKVAQRRARQQFNGFLLRQGRVYASGKKKWTKAHGRWLEGLRFERAVHQGVFEAYCRAVHEAGQRVAALEAEMRAALPEWGLAPVVEALMALRGVDFIAAMQLVAELGDISRFDSPVQLMSYLGLVPQEDSSGARVWRGPITKAGNGHARRTLIESSWSYRFPARKTAHLQRRARHTSEAVQAIAWKAQRRLCGRYRHLLSRGKLPVQAVTAIARELCGFIWAIAHEVMASRNEARG